MDELMRKETQEAINAGERALRSLYAAREQLNSAKSWGFFDMLGGGLFSTMVKHSKMQNASELIEQAKRNLHIFQRELKDIRIPLDLRMEVGGFLSFADFFLDGLVADYLVQSRITEAREQVQDAIEHVEPILRHLRQCMNER